MKQKKTWVYILTIVYLTVLVWIILFKMSTISEIASLKCPRSINLIPFHYDEEVSSHLSEVINNIIVFIPFGVYLKLLGKSNKYTILSGAFISLLLEATQFILAVGASDVTDLLMNTLGTAVGVLIYSFLGCIFKNHSKLDKALTVLACAGTILFCAFAALLIIAN